MKRKASEKTLANARMTYHVELARGSSHIRSTLSAESRELAIAEVIGEFCVAYGNRDLGIFRQLLSDDLRKRGRGDDACVVACYDLALCCR